MKKFKEENETTAKKKPHAHACTFLHLQDDGLERIFPFLYLKNEQRKESQCAI